MDSMIGYTLNTFSQEVLKTTNGGYNWFVINSNLGNKFYFINPNIGFTNAFKTTDGGITWLQQDTYRDILILNSMYFINSTTGFKIGGFDGSILKTTDGGGQLSGISGNLEQIPLQYSLSQNYPNPFNPTTKIKFDISSPVPPSKRENIVKLIIYDLLGREVTTLVNESLKPGTYETEWDGSNFASGIYFYSLITDEFTETKRMVLIK